MYVHPSSLNHGLTRLPEGSQWFAYFERVRTHRVYLRDSSSVPAIAILLFGPDFNLQYTQKTVKVHWARFVCVCSDCA